MKSHNFELLKFAISFADLSRSILKKNFFKTFRIQEKKDGTLVTEIDQEIEMKFRNKLKKKFPNHGVIGEEYGTSNKNSEYVWVIDPLDGTHSFISGKPLFGTLICCLQNQIPILGLIDIPIMDHRWFGVIGNGVKFNNKKCSYKKNLKKFNQLIIASTSPFMFNKKELKLVEKIYSKVRFPVFGTDCYAYGLLVSKKIDLIIEANMQPWDYMAQAFLVKELGGKISDWKGNDLNINSDGRVVASYEANHHKKVITLLKNAN